MKKQSKKTYNDFRKEYDAQKKYSRDCKQYLKSLSKNYTGERSWQIKIKQATNLIEMMEYDEVEKKEVMRTFLDIMREDMNSPKEDQERLFLTFEICLDIMYHFSKTLDDKVYYFGTVYDIMKELNKDKTFSSRYGVEAEKLIIDQAKKYFCDNHQNRKDFEESCKQQECGGYMTDFCYECLDGKENTRTDKARKIHHAKRKITKKIIYILGWGLILCGCFLGGKIYGSSIVDSEIKKLKENNLELEEVKNELEKENKELKKQYKELKEQKENKKDKTLSNNNISSSVGETQKETLTLSKDRYLRTEMVQNEENIIMTIQKGQTVIILEELEDYWKKIKFNENEGYILYP